MKAGYGYVVTGGQNEVNTSRANIRFAPTKQGFSLEIQ